MKRTIEHNIGYLLMDFAPWLVARKAWKAREHLVQSFVEYYEAGGQLNSSQMSYTRWKKQLDGGATQENVARMEALMGLGILSNTVPSSFWAIFDLYSRPELLEEVRNEVRENAVSVDSDGTHTLNLGDIRDKCPLLLGSFEETLRLRSKSAQLRVIFEDTMLEDKYLIKEGSILLMPSVVLNRSVAAWGADANEFNPRRYMDLDTDKKQKASAWMSFGVTPHVCAGRHFVTGEILAMLAMLVLQFDILPAGGKWVEPPCDISAMAASLLPPKGQTLVTFREREDYKGVSWTSHVSKGKGRFGLIIG